MNRILRKLWQLVALTAAGFVTIATGERVGIPVDEDPPLYRIPELARYAETIYEEYSQAAGGRVLFEVVAVERGPLTRLAGATFGELLGPAEMWIEASLNGVRIGNVRWTHPVPVELPDLTYQVEDLAELGYPLSTGIYRRLRVGAALAGEIMTHEALELCWPNQGHCVIIDPSVIFLESIVANRRRLLAEGWGPRVKFGPLLRTKDASGACVLEGSAPQQLFTQVFPSYSINLKDVAGNEVVKKKLGLQEVVVVCKGQTEKTCRADPGVSCSASTCESTPPFTCDHDHKNAEGVSASGRVGKAISETKVAHRINMAAKADGTVENAGTISVDIRWDIEGSVDENGGEARKTCVWQELPMPSD